MSDEEINRGELAGKVIDAGIYKTFWDKPKSEWSVTQQGRICPAFCNLRTLIGDVEMRQTIEDALVANVTNPKNKSTYPDVVCGVVSSGVPWATLLSRKLKLPMCYTRPRLKSHGNKSSIEGKLAPGMQVLLIDDVFSTGNTVIKTSFQLSTAEVEVIRVLVLLRHGNEKVSIHTPSGSFKEIPVNSLIDYHDLVQASVSRGLMNDEQAAKLISYYNDPETQPWS